MAMQDVSVVVPSCNGWAFLRDTLPALLSEPVREVIVVSNGCSDGSAQQLRTHFPEVVCLELPCGNPSVARDHGLRHARSEFVAFRDADDFVIPGALAVQRERLLREPSLDLIGGQVIWRLGQQELRRTHYWQDADMVHAACLFQAPLLLATSMLRRERFLPTWWGPVYTCGEDWDYLWRHLQQGVRMANLAEPVLYYQRREGSLTSTLYPGNSLQDFASVLRMQFLLQSGIQLDAREMMLFANVSPCAYWELHQVPWLRTVPGLLQATQDLLERVQHQNTGVPAAGLARVCDDILAQVRSLPWEVEAAALV